MVVLGEKAGSHRAGRVRPAVTGPRPWLTKGVIRVCAVTRVATNAAAQQGDTALETSGVMGSRLSDLCERACMSLSGLPRS